MVIEVKLKYTGIHSTCPLSLIARLRLAYVEETALNVVRWALLHVKHQLVLQVIQNILSAQR